MSASVEPANAERLSAVMHRLSVHLDKLADHTDAVEHAIGKQLCTKAPPQAAAITQLQSLDYLRQSLEDMAMLTLLLSQAEGIGTVPLEIIDAINTELNLSDTKALICSQTEPGAHVPEFAKSGELDLF